MCCVYAVHVRQWEQLKRSTYTTWNQNKPSGSDRRSEPDAKNSASQAGSSPSRPA